MHLAEVHAGTRHSEVFASCTEESVATPLSSHRLNAGWITLGSGNGL